MKIDFEQLNTIFGDELPSKESFLANNHGHYISTLAIRKHVGVRKTHNFNKAWELFVAEYDAYIATKVKAPVVKDESDDNEDS